MAKKKKHVTKKITKKAISKAKVVVISLAIAASILVGKIAYDMNVIQVGDCVKLKKHQLEYAKSLIFEVIEEVGDDMVLRIVDAGKPSNGDDLGFLFYLLGAERIMLKDSEKAIVKEVACPKQEATENKPATKQTSED